MAWLRVLFFSFVLLSIPAAVVASIGKVLSVKEGASLTRAGKTVKLREGMQVASGDQIATNKTGVVQLIFVDETKIAVGPNAIMSLDVTMLRGNRKAKSFAVQALGGSYRFISGNSRKRAYSIKTPTATMAVRGTTFDMWITADAQSAMLVLEGTVRMCGARGSCRSASRQCSLFATGDRGRIGRPKDQEQYEKALNEGFPFIRSQQRLLPPFQIQIGGCGREEARAPRVEVDHAEPDRSPARREPEKSKPEPEVRAPEPPRS